MRARFQYSKPVRRRDETVKIWDLNVGKCVNTLVGHTDNVWYLQFDDDKIISGSADKTMCFWDFRYAPCCFASSLLDSVSNLFTDPPF
jgi:WD40 repeat protein